MKKILLFLCAIFFTANVLATGIGANDITASCDNETLGQTSGTANIEIDWQPNTIAVRWYDGEHQLTVQSSALSCVYDDDLYLPNTQPTKTGYTFKGWKVIKVPEGYTELEYIQSDGSQYIDTGINTWNNTLEFEQKVNIQQQDTGIHSYWGAYDRWSTDGHVTPNISTYGDYNVQNHFIAGRNPSNGFDIGMRNGQTGIYQLKGDVLSWSEGTSVRFDRGEPFVVSKSIYLFAIHYYDKAQELSKFKMYYMKFWLDNQLIRNFIPARRNSDNVVGMWDTISGTFFTNAGTGTFTAGPVVQ
jgi:hypothetical protein